MKPLTLFALTAMLSVAQIPTPESVLGHKPGDDFYLATYEDALGYFKKLGRVQQAHQAGAGGQDHAGPRLVHRLHLHS